jgi:hypothetical protein
MLHVTLACLGLACIILVLVGMTIALSLGLVLP